MCQNHNNAKNSEAVRELTEARHDKSICKARISFLERRVLEFIQYLDSQGKPGKLIVKRIHDAHLKAMEEDVFTEFYFTVARDEYDTSMVDIGSENHAVQLPLYMEGKDGALLYPNGLKPVISYSDVRMEDDFNNCNAYWGQLHRIAYTAFMKHINEPSERGKEVFDMACKILDQAEAYFNPDQEERTKRLPYQVYKKLSGFVTKEQDGKKIKELDPKSLRARINLHRFQLYTLTHEQWAYLTNWLNVLTSWVDPELVKEQTHKAVKTALESGIFLDIVDDFEDPKVVAELMEINSKVKAFSQAVTREAWNNQDNVKQYPCEMQNVLVDQKWVNPEDAQWEIVNVFYTRD